MKVVASKKMDLFEKALKELKEKGINLNKITPPLKPNVFLEEYTSE